MDFISAKEALTSKGTIRLRGWVYRERKLGDKVFVVLRDSTGVVQCVIKENDVKLAVWREAQKAEIEASCELTGKPRADERAPGGVEIDVTDFKIVGPSHQFPITKDKSFEYLLDIRHLWLRSRELTSIMKVRSTVFGAIHDYFRGEGFYEYQSPIFQAMQCEGGSSLFKVNYFGDEVYLAQTWQLFAEPAIFALEKIYTIAPSFRAEKSKTSRHLTEYWHAEMEMAWSDFEEIKDHGEKLLKHIIKKVLDERAEELKLLNRDTKTLQASLKKPFVRMTYTDALKMLKDKCGIKVQWGKDLRTIEEDKLSALYDVPIIVDQYPKAVKAFYMREVEGNPKVVQGFDFIAPEGHGELIGGSQRETDIEKLKKNLKEQGEDPKKYEFYFDTRKYGSVPHGGFGLGVERVVSWVCGLDNIKNAIPFPRTIHRYKP